MRRISRTVALLAATALLAACTGGGDGADDSTDADGAVTEASAILEGVEVAATAEGTEITAAEVEEVVALQRAQALQGLEGDALARAEADLVRQVLSGQIQLAIVEAVAERDYGIVVTEEDVDAAYEEAVAELGDEEAFLEAVAAQGLDEDDVREQLEVEQLVTQVQEALADEAGEVTDEDVRALFDERDEAGALGEATVRHILVETEEEAQDVLDRLEDGEDFGAVAEEVSTDPGSGAQGGELGTQPRGTYVPPFEEVVWDPDTPLGEVQGPVESQFGFHLIIVDDREVPEFADAESDLRAELEQQATGSAFQAFIEEALANAEVEVDPAIGTWDAESGTVVAPPA